MSEVSIPLQKVVLRPNAPETDEVKVQFKEEHLAFYKITADLPNNTAEVDAIRIRVEPTGESFAVPENKTIALKTEQQLLAEEEVENARLAGIWWKWTKVFVVVLTALALYLIFKH